MSTRAYILQQLDDGSIRGVYSHWDGYPSGLGQTLLDYYTDSPRVTCLLDLGDLSCVGRYLEPSAATKAYGFGFNLDEEFMKLPDAEQESLRRMDREHVTAYHRDRGEALNIEKWKDEDEVKRNFDTGFGMISFVYLFKNGQWYVLELPGKRFKRLTQQYIAVSD